WEGLEDKKKGIRMLALPLVLTAALLAVGLIGPMLKRTDKGVRSPVPRPTKVEVARTAPTVASPVPSAPVAPVAPPADSTTAAPVESTASTASPPAVVETSRSVRPSSPTKVASPTKTGAAPAAPGPSTNKPPPPPPPAPAGPTRLFDNGIVDMTSAAPGQKISIDGRIVGETPQSVTVPCGRHSIQIGSKRARTIDVP